MNPELLHTLHQWPATRHGADVRRVENRSSFSGAEVWRVAADGREFALRHWPIEVVKRRLTEIHTLQSYLTEKGFEVVPHLQRTFDGEMFVADERERLWELASWRPGEPDVSQSPPVKRVRAALRMLAAIHLAARFDRAVPLAPSPSIKRREERLAKFLGGDEGRIASRANDFGGGPEQELLRRAFWGAFRQRFDQLRAAAEFAAVPLPIQPRLGDARREHFLFTGDQVTGVIDFGAADVDSPAGDVARILGGLAGDDQELWAAGIAAYETVRPLSDDERRAVEVFDATGTVISVMNWLRWLFDECHALAPNVDRQAALERLAHLTQRLETLAEPRDRDALLD